MRYDAGGSITFKTGVGDYSYDGPRPHAVTGTSISSISYQYDGNGNLTGDGNGRTLEYSVFDKPTLIAKGSHSTHFLYGPDRGRYKRVDDNQNGTVTTLQIGSVEKVIERTEGGSFIKAYYRRSLAGVAVETLELDQSDQVTDRETRYLLKDLQGSLDVITTATGQVAVENGQKQVFSFDPWGKRRAPLTWEQLGTPENIVATLKVGSFNHLTTNKGYTGHEMLDEAGLIHMNGRVYDPTLSRFVSADPVIDGVTSVQGYNRYAYVHNNPLAYTDPSGYSKWTRFRDRWVNGRAVHYRLSQNSTLNAVVQVGICIVAQAACPAVLAAYNAEQTYHVTGSWALAFRNGTLAGISAAAFSGLPSGWGVEAFAMRGFVGGVVSIIGGGKFGHGFVSAGVGGGFSRDTGLVTRVLVSGAISDATGGKFISGAATAAFAWAMRNGLSGGCNMSRDEWEIRRAIAKARAGKLAFKWPDGVTIDLSEIDKKMWVGGMRMPDGSVDFNEEVIYEGSYSSANINKLGMHRVAAQVFPTGENSWRVEFYAGVSDVAMVDEIINHDAELVDPSQYEIVVTGKQFSAPSVVTGAKATEYFVTHGIYSHIILGIGGGPDEFEASTTALKHLEDNVW